MRSDGDHPGRRARRPDPTSLDARVSLVEVALYGVLASVVAGTTLVLLDRPWSIAALVSGAGLALVALVTLVLSLHGRSRRESRDAPAARGYQGKRRKP